MKSSLAVTLKAVFSKKRKDLYEKVMMTEHAFMIFAALIIGTLAGYGTIIIRYLIKYISEISFSSADSFLEAVIATPWYLRLGIPAAGGLIMGPILYYFSKESRRSGVPDVMQSVMVRGGYIRPRVAIVKAITTAIAIGTGGSVGREGPIVQIGSSIGSSIGQFFRVSHQRLKTFVGCGAAAGIAAAFNAPIAGALFAVEIILQDFAFAQFSPIVISSVMATVISHHFAGNFAEFQVPTYTLVSYHELIFYFMMAFCLAVVGVVFTKVLFKVEDLFEKHVPLPDYLKPAIGGLLIGIIALKFPQIMGIGYESINNALHGKTLGVLALVLILIKIFSTSISLGAGSSGGIFAPSLFLGAMTGVTFGSMVHRLFPDMTGGPGAYALVAMGGLVAAVTHAPITAIIMIFELTNNYSVILPLMITCIISMIVSSSLQSESVYTLNLVRRKVHIKNGSETDIMRSIFVKRIYSKNFEWMEHTLKFNQVVDRLITAKNPYFPVLNGEKKLIGMISMQDIKEYLFEKDMLQDLLIADDIAVKNLITVRLGDNCQDVLEKLTRSILQGVPVVSDKDPTVLLGMLWRKDIYAAYNQEKERRNLASSFASKITMKNIDQTVQFMEGYSLTEIPVPKYFVGKSIKDLNIRAKFNVDVILIRGNSSEGSIVKAMPSPEYIFSITDSILVMGEIGKINLLKSV